MTQKFVLNDAIKGFTLDQDKIISPAETVARFKEKARQLNLNILEKTIRIDNGRLDIPVYFSVCGSDAYEIIGTKKQMGKGATPQQAEASAVMELAERFSFFSFCKNPDNFVFDSYNNLKPKAIDFELIAQSVHDESDDLSITRKMFENLKIKWTKAYNLTTNQYTLVPFDWFYAINEFNGPSAGNCVEEAISQGICEIVERHTSSLVSQNHIHAPLIDLKSIEDAVVKEMLNKYSSNGIKVYLSDFTLNMGIPTIGAFAYDPKTFPEKSELIWTAGTTPDPLKAVSRALTEVAQLAGDFNTGANYVASGLPKYNALSEAKYIIDPGKTISLADLPNISNSNIRIEVENLVQQLAQRNMQVFLLDTTHKILQIPAFYTIIPGAHFRERARGTSVGMFAAKLITQTQPAEQAIKILSPFDLQLKDKYYLKFYLGTCFLSLSQPQKALYYFNEALELNPLKEDLASIYSYMGICFKNMENYQKALEVLKKGVEIDSERTDLYNLMGFCYFKLKEHQLAIESFENVLKLDSSSAIDYANIASNYRELGKTQEAIDYYELAIMMDPSIEFAKDNLEKLKKNK